jgi:hypothetical protein
MIFDHSKSSVVPGWLGCWTLNQWVLGGALNNVACPELTNEWHALRWCGWEKLAEGESILHLTSILWVTFSLKLVTT